jgi:purine-nucleoside phosphorylase
MKITYQEKVIQAAEFLKSHYRHRPLLGILSGTGLGEMMNTIDVEISFDYKDIPNFPVSTVESHPGRLYLGHLQGKTVIAMQGRFHLYEGYSPLEVTFPIRVMQLLGIQHLILSNAAGGLNPTLHPGDIMIISDHINLTGENPLIGPNEDTWGIRFPDMAEAYNKMMISHAKKAGEAFGLDLPGGIYAGLKGPSLETPAEILFLKTIGAEAVGFSTVQEVIAAVHAGIKVLGLSTITNVHEPEDPKPATVEEIIAVAAHRAPLLGKIIEKIVGDLND